MASETTRKVAEKIVSFTFDDYPDNSMNRGQLTEHVADLVAAAIAGEPDPDDLDTDYYLIFCDICGVAAEHVLVEDEWQCCGPAHPR